MDPWQAIADTRADRLWLLSAVIKAVVPQAPTSEPSREPEAGWLEEYIGYMQDHGCTWTVQVILGNDEGTRRGEDVEKHKEPRGTYCISFWCVFWLLKYVMSGTGPTCHCCMICDKQRALATLPTQKANNTSSVTAADGRRKRQIARRRIPRGLPEGTSACEPWRNRGALVD